MQHRQRITALNEAVNQQLVSAQVQLQRLRNRLIQQEMQSLTELEASTVGARNNAAMQMADQHCKCCKSWQLS